MKFWLAWPAGNPGGRRLGIPEHKNFLISKYGKQEGKREKIDNWSMIGRILLGLYCHLTGLGRKGFLPTYETQWRHLWF